MSPAAVQAAYVRALATSAGPAETVNIVRQGVAYPAQAWVTEFVPSDLAGAVEQGRRNAIVLASSLVASGFPLPIIVKQDRLVWGLNGTPKSNAITKVDDSTRRIGGTLIAYELDLDGA